MLRNALLGGCLLVPACSNKGEQQFQEQQQGPSSLGASASVKGMMEARGLSEADVEAALKTYTPTGKKDDYMIFASGGHSGQIIVIGVPSMFRSVAKV